MGGLLSNSSILKNKFYFLSYPGFLGVHVLCKIKVLPGPNLMIKQLNAYLLSIHLCPKDIVVMILIPDITFLEHVPFFVTSTPNMQNYKRHKFTFFLCHYLKNLCHLLQGLFKFTFVVLAQKLKPLSKRLPQLRPLIQIPR